LFLLQRLRVSATNWDSISPRINDGGGLINVVSTTPSS
jgi:hypothetical protein